MRGGVEFDFEFDFGTPGGFWRVITMVVGLLVPVAAGAQEAGGARAAVVGDTVRVGDVVPVAVRVTIERGERVAWPDTLSLAGDEVENAARVRERVDTLADGRLEVTGVYSVTPWQTGEVSLPDLAFQVVTGREGVRELTVALPPLDVVSVLPPDTADLEPKPAKGVIGRSWAMWPFVLALLALAALIAVAIWWRRRRLARQPAVPLAPPVPPRERVLARLQEARDAGLIERGEMKAFYTQVTDAVRDYLAAIGPGWSEDLTTSELLARFRAQLGPEAARPLGDVLRQADQVKFARRTPDPETAVREWEATRGWVVSFEWPPRRENGGVEAGGHGEAE